MTLVRLVLVLLVAATPAFAHDGGAAGGFVTGFLHPVFGWDHVAAMVAVGLWGAFLGAPAIWLLPVAFPLVMAMGGAAGAAGVSFPAVETGIAASALVIGIAVALAARPPFWVAAVIVGCFAIFHGHAHGTEMHEAASPLAYAAGLVIATGLLHLAGIAFGLLAASRPGALAVRAPGRRHRACGTGLSDRRVMRRQGHIPALLVALLAPGSASAHDAFGDLGPFYANLLHPLADPKQGLLIAAVAILLVRQPLDTVRPAYAALVVGGAVTILVGALVSPDPPGLRVTGLVAAALGTAALFGLTLGPLPAVLLAAAIAVAAGLAVDLPPGTRAAALSAFGAMLGIALSALLVWGLVDTARRRLGPVAGAVAGSWVAAVGIMATALPSG